MNKILRTSAVFVLAGSLGLSACKKDAPAGAPPPSGIPAMQNPPPPAAPNAALPGAAAGHGGAVHPSTDPAAAPGGGAPAAGTITGTLVERIEAASYSYLRIKTTTGEVWAAVPEVTIPKGAEVTVLAQMEMQNFESKTLGRKFDKLIFGTLPGAPGAAAPGSANPHAPMPGAPGAPPPAHPAPTPAADVGDVKTPKATGEGARTVAEVFAQKIALKGQKVAVRGKVVKYTASVMGKNWIHLRDGSGGDATNDNDLTITTGDVTAVGEVVTVRGAVAIAKDFGAGYAYPVLVEDAKIEK